ncbi:MULTISPECIES: aldehyde dehydrogenase family protein [unclassified Sphingomonas]|jgi:aldehyde dehydrogenase (NAD+)|uniref:aldehyde dehydrogenase family protein n=1 Tax=unclassified Sphingomonas TaxID=196159 RepID=UPI0021519B84|nr:MULTISPECIES: aldehyde dehydrogenase family protein [unclassified Sphingomonas]MCR5871024.1 aldehyde dehydrogenase family protein [Sphingomonas sp. J344]UUY00655.1 aldehyde dehydrogenase family protein [Sphingomonas sp. J315]
MANPSGNQRRSEASLYIDGAFVGGLGAPVDVENPSDGTIFATVQGASAAQVESAIHAAWQARQSGLWSGRPAADRAADLSRMIAWFADNKDVIEDLLVAEAGVVRASLVRAGQLDAAIQHATDLIELFLTLPEIEDNPLPLRDRFKEVSAIQSLRRYESVGVVAAISAYNFPFVISMWKTISALIAGNSVVLRPSPLAPLSSLVFGEAAHTANLPAGVFNVIVESGAEGAVLLGTDPRVDMVSFTGSTKVGQQVMVQAAATMKRLQLELGGKSAQIFLPDATALASTAGNRACVPHSGQVCVAGTRIFVPQDEKEAIMAAIAQSLAGVVIGPADHPATTMGPLINGTAVRRCEAFVADALASGARLICGGRRPPKLDHGHYFEPTILDLPDCANIAAREEIFGPIACVIGYRDIDHAIEMANDTPYGLSGHVFGKDLSRAIEVACRLRTGSVNVNGSALSAFASGGGQRLSGVGRERGIEGLRIYQELKCITVVS